MIDFYIYYFHVKTFVFTYQSFQYSACIHR